MRLSNIQLAGVILISVIIGYILKATMKEGFQTLPGLSTPAPPMVTPPSQTCPKCNEMCSDCPPTPDLTKYVLKTSIPPCPVCPDMAMYMLKTECPPAADLSQYVLKSSIPKPDPIIIDNSSCGKSSGPCPPCPRPRCPEVKCPGPVTCPACPPCARAKCPQKVVKCKAEDSDTHPVRPYLTPLSVTGFGSA